MKNKKSVRDVAIEIFRIEGKPIHYKELTKNLLNKCNLTGKTPHESVRSLIGTDDRFKRVAEGVYALSEWEEYPVARYAKDIAYEILSNLGKPLLFVELGKQIFIERKFVGSPNQTVRNIFHSDDRFYFEKESNLVGLVEWLEEKD
jgi:hypothetical protein